MNTIAITEVARLNNAAGFQWFERGTLRFFRSRYSSLAYLTEDGTTAYFVSSEADGLDGVRLYSVRVAVITGPNAGSIDTVGEFQQYATRGTADRVARRLAKGTA